MADYSFALVVLASILATGAIALVAFRLGYRLGIDTLVYAHRLAAGKEPAVPAAEKNPPSEPVPEDAEAMRRKTRTV